MRLSLQKAAQASMGGAAYRKSGSPRLFRPRYPGFPVEVGGVAELHAAFLNESRTRGPVWCSVTGNPGTLGRTWGTLRCSAHIAQQFGRQPINRSDLSKGTAEGMSNSQVGIEMRLWGTLVSA
jgi:hypothetical protein